VPVSLIGTFAVMQAFGFSLNNLTLFGLVLAIGIVVDDAIVVVENVEHHMAAGLARREATIRAMGEVSAPIVAISLVLSSIFVPTAFLPGITGAFYKQFALTIAVSTLLSAINSLTLSPALCAVFLQDPRGPKDLPGRIIDGVLGGFFRLFNRVFRAATGGYLAIVRRCIRFAFLALAVYLGLLVLTGQAFRMVPAGFIPAQDQGYMFVNVELPEAASLERTAAVVDKVERILKSTPGIAHTIVRVGNSNITNSTAPNAGTIIAILDPFDRREKPELSLDGIISSLRPKFREIREASVLALGPPPVRGLGSTSGVVMMVQDRVGRTPAELENAVGRVVAAGRKDPDLDPDRVFSLYHASTPQIGLEIDRIAAKSRGVDIAEIAQTLQFYLGSIYVNDLTLFGRPYQVTAQADASFRARPDDILGLKTRNAAGEMVPLGSVVRITETNAPSRVIRYNLYPAAEVRANPAAGHSSGQAISAMQDIAATVLPVGFGYEWTDMALQEVLAGNSALVVFPLCVLFVFLVLAAQYENWSLPFAIILIVPLCLLGALGGTFLAGGDNNIFTQVGFVVLIGLACKNAILIVEFAKQAQDRGITSAPAAALRACHLRLRPILMTSFAFILGVFPLVVAHGAGSEMRRSLGVAVFSGMLGVTFFGIFLTPVFYSLIRGRLLARRKSK